MALRERNAVLQKEIPMHQRNLLAALAALGALAAVSFHEMFDFGMVIPANGLALAVVVGAALAARTSSDPEA